jgi:hypothetical protein
MDEAKAGIMGMHAEAECTNTQTVPSSLNLPAFFSFVTVVSLNLS